MIDNWFDTGASDDSYIQALHSELADTTIGLRSDPNNTALSSRLKTIISKIKDYQHYSNRG